MSEFNYDPVATVLSHVAIEEAKQKRIEELEAALVTYGQHTDACAIVYEPKCTCGLNAVLANLEKR